MAESRKYTANLGEELSGLYDLCKSMASENLKFFSELRSGTDTGLDEIQVAVQESFVKKQKEFEDAMGERFSSITANVEKQKTIMDRIEGHAVALNESVNVAIERGDKTLAELSVQERALSSSFGEEIGAMQQMLEGLQQKWQQMEGFGVQKEQSRAMTIAATRECLQKNVQQTVQLRGEVEAVNAEIRDTVTDTEKVIEQRTHEAETDSSSVEEIAKRVKEDTRNAESAFNEQLTAKCETFNASVQVANQRVVDEVERQAKEMEVAQTNVTNISEKVESFVGNFEDFSSGCVQAVRGFCNKDLETYRPTGETPAKKNFQYPKSLTQTSPHGRILQRFRYDPNNSFNSSSDILPGLDDSTMEPNIEEDGDAEAQAQAEEQETDEVEFEDAQEENCTTKEAEAKRDSENAENENPNVQRKKRSTGSGGKAANRPLLEVQQRDTIYVSSDDVSGGGGAKRFCRRSPANSRSPPVRSASLENSKKGQRMTRRSPMTTMSRSSVVSKSPVWRNS